MSRLALIPVVQTTLNSGKCILGVILNNEMICPNPFERVDLYRVGSIDREFYGCTGQLRTSVRKGTVKSP
jgi:hypothetical protein